MNTIGDYSINAYTSYTNNYQSNKATSQTQDINKIAKASDLNPELIDSKSISKSKSVASATTPQLLPKATTYSRQAGMIEQDNQMPGQHIDIKL